jgi:plasmid stabilization system protein ParE
MTPEEADAEENPLSVYAVRLTTAIKEQTVAAFFWINDNMGIDAADDWQNGMDAVWASLATLPYRCQVAEENRIFQKKYPGSPLRVFWYRHGRSTWQILFTIHEAEDDQAYIKLHQIRNAAQKPLTKWPDEG